MLQLKSVSLKQNLVWVSEEQTRFGGEKEKLK